jgi:hypothetical protein
MDRDGVQIGLAASGQAASRLAGGDPPSVALVPGVRGVRHCGQQRIDRH